MKTRLLMTTRAGLLGLVFFLPFSIFAQTAPYALSPKWMFGNKGMFDFTGGGAPTQPARIAGDNIIANEGSSTLCDSLKNVAVYDNNVRIAGNNSTPLGTPMVNASSSTQGGVIIPNPANPYGQFYILTGNSESAYTTEEPDDDIKEGLKIYRTSKSGTTVTNPTLVSALEADPDVREYVYASSDGNYGYWILSARVLGGNTNFYAWPVPAATGTIGARVTSPGSTAIWNEQYQGCVKVNRCQTRIALAQGSSIQVYEYDRTTGEAGNVLVSYINPSPTSKYYGCEFSPSGNYLYVTTLDISPLTLVNIGTGAVTKPFAGNASASLQLGPNNVIYVANGLDGSSTSNVGTITNTDAGGVYNATGVALANGSTTRLGISNIPWINPRKPKITRVLNSCGNYTFTPGFLTYFKDVININKAVWNFGDGSPTVTNTGGSSYNNVNHVYTSSGTKTITLTVTDATCSQDWTGTLSLNVPCALPVELIRFTAEVDGPSNTVLLNWSTASELNNDYFELQRSANGTDFTTIARIKGGGNSQTILDYQYLDLQAFAGVQYYRLAQHDYDGKTENSDILTIHMNAAEISILPNPSEGEFTIRVNTTEASSLVVYDVLGVEVSRTEISNASSVFHFGKELSAGYYVAKYFNSKESRTFKIEKR